MAVAITEITAVSQYDTQNIQTYTTPNLTAVANRLYVLKTTASYASGITLSSVSGGGLGTWNIIGGNSSVENSGANRRLEAAWMWLSSPGGAEAISIQWSGACTSCGYSLFEVTGFNTVTPIGQVNNNRANGATALTVTLASATAGSGIISSCRINAEETINTELGWTAGEMVTGANPSCTLQTAYRTDANDLSSAFTWTTSTVSIGNIIEILAASEGGGGVVHPVLGNEEIHGILFGGQVVR